MPNFQLLLSLPNHVCQLGVCLVMHNPTPQLLEWLKDHSIREFVVKPEESTDSDVRWIEGILESWEDKNIHFHLELAKTKPEPAEIADAKEYTLDEITERCEEFLVVAAGQSAEVRSRVIAEVSPLELSKSIRAVVNAAPEETPCLASVEFTVADDIFYHLTVKIPDDRPSVRVTLFGCTDMPLDQEVYHRMAQLMNFGLTKFALAETPEDVSHV